MINIDEFKKIEIVVGEILSAEKIPETEKLLKLQVSFGPLGISGEEEREIKNEIRQVVSGISEYFSDPNALIGKKCMFVSNLEPRTIRGFESQGMILAVTSNDGKFSLLVPENDVPAGAKAR